MGVKRKNIACVVHLVVGYAKHGDGWSTDSLLYALDFAHSFFVGIALVHPRVLVRRARVILLKRDPTW